MQTDIGDEEITLAYNDLRLRVSPYGASLRGLWQEGADGQRRDIITGYTGAKGKVGGQGDVLIPFPGRVRDGWYTFEGQTYQMPINDKDGPNAIHGFVRLMPWEITAHFEHEVRFAVSLPADAHPGYPFALSITVFYMLEETGLWCLFEVTNRGDRPAPFAAGFHPYFTVGSEQIDADTLTLPFAHTLDFKNLLPTGKALTVDDTPFDFRAPRTIGSTQFNTCYLNPQRDADGRVRIRLATPNGERAVTIWMARAFNYVVLYSGDPLPDSHRRRALAIEPMTCASDAFNHPDWGLITLAPNESLSGSWGVTLE
jgi:aldose 1-epimerase